MDSKSNYSVQDKLLSLAIQKKKLMTLFLKNKSRITGSIRNYDAFTILIETEKSQILAFKQSVTTIFISSPPRRAARE